MSAPLVFELPTSAAAAQFFGRVNGEAKLSHRVVEVRTDHADEARELAKALGGHEA